jgi:Ca2+-binding EF-hand superfamily protein
MTNRVPSQASSWRTPRLAIAALSAAILFTPLAVSAQERDRQETGTQSSEPRVSRGAERFIRLFDMNGDGKVSIEEINSDQARMFTALDIDDNKQMSVEEIRRRGRSLQIFRTTTLFDLLDTNGDGQLSLAEVQSPSQRWFKRYDQNGDGVMDASEVPSQRHWGRGGRR